MGHMLCLHNGTGPWLISGVINISFSWNVLLKFPCGFCFFYSRSTRLRASPYGKIKGKQEMYDHEGTTDCTYFEDDLDMMLDELEEMD